MWRVPTDIPQVAVPNGLKLAEVTMDTPLDEVFKHWKESGAVILKNILTPAEASQITTELESRLDSIQRSSLVPHPDLSAFHGPKTKRAGDLINHSATFREQILENDFIHAICKRCFSEGGHNGDYWLSTASTLNASGPQPPQVLHRDLTSYPPYAQLGPEGTEAKISFLFAFSDFREDNGATRIIPGSNKWPFHQRGNMKQTIPAEMKKGDCLLIGGKVIHGMGENKTETERKCIQLTVVPSFLTPSEAQPFIIKLETVKKLSKRAQWFVGFRLQYPRGLLGLWTKDYIDLALHLGLDDLQGVMKDLQHVIDQPKQWDMIDYDNLETEKSADISC
ncbi:toxin biosynthesis protein [Coccidioides immitis RS]|uniref:Toxin biosynthesis protein n=1 Tax=Coccidioides immitis (strain RS) TaxID=246410 RepID=J3K6K6_COCIM|nr:toxin biosynthesis protein [Coccidioides immitis RS]EAS30225.3 toxin biosynthesis protein [Coccidioides immitis RS]